MDDFHDRQLDQFTLVLTLNTVDGERAKQLLDANPTFDRVQLLRAAARYGYLTAITNLTGDGVPQEWVFNAIIDTLNSRRDGFDRVVKHLLDAQPMGDELLYGVVRDMILNSPTPQPILDFVMDKCDACVLESVWESLHVDGRLVFSLSPSVIHLRRTIQSRQDKKALEEQVGGAGAKSQTKKKKFYE